MEGIYTFSFKFCSLLLLTLFSLVSLLLFPFCFLLAMVLPQLTTKYHAPTRMLPPTLVGWGGESGKEK